MDDSAMSLDGTSFMLEVQQKNGVRTSSVGSQKRKYQAYVEDHCEGTTPSLASGNSLRQRMQRWSPSPRVPARPIARVSPSRAVVAQSPIAARRTPAASRHTRTYSSPPPKPVIGHVTRRIAGTITNIYVKTFGLFSTIWALFAGVRSALVQEERLIAVETDATGHKRRAVSMPGTFPQLATPPSSRPTSSSSSQGPTNPRNIINGEASTAADSTTTPPPAGEQVSTSPPQERKKISSWHPAPQRRFNRLPASARQLTIRHRPRPEKQPEQIHASSAKAEQVQPPPQQPETATKPEKQPESAPEPQPSIPEPPSVTQLVQDALNQLGTVAEPEIVNQDPLYRELTEEWAAKVDKVMATKDRTASVALTVDGTNLSRHDMGCLIPQPNTADNMIGWLNDEIVNAWISAIVERKNQKHNIKRGQVPVYSAYPSAWYTNYKNKGITGIRGWSRRKQIQGSKLLGCQKIFFPVNTGAHWMLLLIEPTFRRITFLDSLSSPSYEKKFFGVAREWLKMELGKDYKPEEWTDYVDAHSAMQTNDNDCGVFVCYNALAMARGDPLTDVSGCGANVGRRMMAAILIHGGFRGDWDLKDDS